VKGAPGLPALAVAEWTTPPDAGHFCLQVELIWPTEEDANPFNNLGQLNTDVKVLQSPAVFNVPVRNDDLGGRRVIRLAVDAYQIPAPHDCEDGDDGHADHGQHSDDATRSRHSAARFPIPEGWTVQAMPAELTLAPGAEEIVTVTATAPTGFEGRQAFNVNGVDENGRLVGGVTLFVESARE